jgi:hypothetical protein
VVSLFLVSIVNGFGESGKSPRIVILSEAKDLVAHRAAGASCRRKLIDIPRSRTQNAKPPETARLAVLQQWILRLLVVAIALPILMCILFGLAYLLAALEDHEGSLVVVRTNLVLAVLWVFDVFLLVIALALSALMERTARSVETTEEIITPLHDEEQ